MNYRSEGGYIVGEEEVPGNSPQNDTARIDASPGEIVMDKETLAKGEKAWTEKIHRELGKNGGMPEEKTMAEGGKIDNSVSPENALNQYVPDEGIVGGTVFDGSSDERFLFGDYCFDIDRAREISGKSWNAEIPVSQKWIDKIKLDKKAALKSDSKNPVFIAQLQTPNGLKPLLIDGNHRMYRAIWEGKGSIKAYIFSPEETVSLFCSKPSSITHPRNGSTRGEFCDGGMIPQYFDGGMVQPEGRSPSGSASDDFSDLGFKEHPDDFSDLGFKENPAPEQGLGERIGRGVLKQLPMIGAIVGGLAATPETFGAGTIPGAAAGAIAGKSLENAGENYFFGEGPKSREEEAKGLGKGAIEGAEQEMGGQIIGPAVKSFAESGLPASEKIGDSFKNVMGYLGEMNTGVPQEAIRTYIEHGPEINKLYEQYGSAQNAANDYRTQVQSAIESAKDRLQEEARVHINSNSVDMTPREVGDSLKNTLTQQIKEKYGPFSDAYSKLDSFAQGQQIPDDAKIKFGDDVKGWALDEFPQSTKQYQSIKNYVDSFQASNNGKQFQNVLKSLNGDINASIRSGDYDNAAVLRQLRSKASDFYESQIESIAKGIDKGNSNIFNSMSGMEPDQARAAALEYLQSKEKVNSDYGGFKNFLEGLQEQTKTSGNGPKSIIENLNDVPSEKLVQKMFDTKNSAALQEMQAQSPEAFDLLMRHKTGEIAKDSLTDGKIDVTKFNKELSKYSPEVQSALLPDEALSSINETANHPELNRLQEIVSRGKNKMLLNNDENAGTLIAAGSGKNPRAKETLDELSQLTGYDLTGPAEKIASMHYFGSPEGIPVDSTGKASTRVNAARSLGVVGGGLLGGMVAGREGAMIGAAGGGLAGGFLSSPRLLKMLVDTGRIAPAEYEYLTRVIQSGAGQKTIGSVIERSVQDAVKNKSKGQNQ
jgi:hypothetical protein